MLIASIQKDTKMHNRSSPNVLNTITCNTTRAIMDMINAITQHIVITWEMDDNRMADIGSKP